MAVHNLSAPNMTVGWNDFRDSQPNEGETIEMMDDRGVIVLGKWQRHAAYSYEGKHYTPTLWRSPRAG